MDELVRGKNVDFSEENYKKFYESTLHAMHDLAVVDPHGNADWTVTRQEWAEALTSGPIVE